jgi:hypothetical protein
MNHQKAEETARQKAKLKVEFRIHLVTYIIVNAFLATINLLLTPEYLWIIWPLMGWGIGLIIHGLQVYLSTNSSFKERMIEKEMRKQ